MQLWGSAYESEATPADGSRFYTGTSDLRRVQYMDATEKMLWRWPMPEWPGAFINGFLVPPTVARDRIVVGGLDGTLYGFPMK